MPHDHVQALDGIKWHRKVLPSQHSLKMIEMNLGHVFDAYLNTYNVERGKRERERERERGNYNTHVHTDNINTRQMTQS